MSVKVNRVTVDPADWGTPQMGAVHELLRQQAAAQGYLPSSSSVDDATIQTAIERLLQSEVQVPEPTPEECRRWYDTHLAHYRSGELVHARHILFQITPGAPVAAICSVAEAVLKELRQHPEVFEQRARDKSNCPSGAQGGQLGQLSRGTMVSEFEKAVFDGETIGVLPQLVQTRFGFHIVSVDQRIPGKQLPFEAVAERVAAQLRSRSEERALRQYVQMLAGQAELEGVELEASGSPLVQ